MHGEPDPVAASSLVDWHAHWMPPTLLRLLQRRTHPPRILFLEGQPHLDNGSMLRRLSLVALDLDERRHRLLRIGISRQVLSLSSLWNIDNLPLAQSLPLVQAFNDDTAHAVAAAPLFFRGLAALPLRDLDAAARELERSMACGLDGLILPAAAFETFADATRMAPLLAKADAIGAHLLIHPGQLLPRGRVTPDVDNAWARRIVLETQHQLSAAMLTLCSTAILRDYPNLTIQVANLGGALPFYLDRLRAVAAEDPHGRGWTYDPGRLTLDCASFGVGAIGLALDAFGTDRIVLGTDMPIFDPDRAVRGLRQALAGRRQSW